MTNERLAALRHDLDTLRLLWNDPRLPRKARLLLAALLGLTLSPIDLVPDFIPVLGQLDDWLLLGLGIPLLLRWIPPEAWQDARRQARQRRDLPSF